VAGDEHATASSQLHLSTQELAAMRRPLLLVDGGHFAMILEPETQQRLLECLVE